MALVEEVHRILGQYSDADERSGWISGLAEAEAILRPTVGGLRIGKKGRERAAGEPFDDRLEWELDGQYFHYLTKWMYALERVAHVTEQSRYLIWAMELARKAGRAFTYTTGSGRSKRMYWKMSVDLSRPQVTSMGQHDPLDGLVTFTQLESAAEALTDIPRELHLNAEIEEFRAMCTEMRWSTDDSLGIGGLLADAFRLAQLITQSGLNESSLLADLLNGAEAGLEMFVRKGHLQIPAAHRLAFRELGLSIGIHAIGPIQNIVQQQSDLFPNSGQLLSSLSGLDRFRRLAEAVEGFWLQPEHQRCYSWTEYEDINSVMLATSLVPAAYPGY